MAASLFCAGRALARRRRWRCRVSLCRAAQEAGFGLLGLRSDKGALRCGPHRTCPRLSPVPSPRAGLSGSDWFTEGVDKFGLKEASALLDRPGSQLPPAAESWTCAAISSVLPFALRSLCFEAMRGR